MSPRSHRHPLRRLAAARRSFARLALAFLVLSLLAPAAATPALAGPAPGTTSAPGLPLELRSDIPPRPRVVLVLLDGIALDELTSATLPNFQRLQRLGCVGLTTSPLAVGPRNASAYATIGSGYNVPSGAAPLQYANGYDAGERISGSSAAAVYTRNTGESPGGAEVVDPDIAALERAFDSQDVNAVPGALGSALHAGGLHTAVVGNADAGWDAMPDRAASLIAMDSSGTVDVGSVGREMLVPDNTFPFGVRTNYARLEEATLRALARADLVVVETGDTRRARAEAPSSLAVAAEAMRRRSLGAADAFIGRLLPLVDERTLLLVVSPSPPDGLVRSGKALAPVFAAGGDFPRGGVLYSPTTRHRGVIAPHDLTATILAHLQVRPQGPMVGLAVSGRPSAGATAMLLDTVSRAGDLHRERASVLVVFVMYQVLLLLWLAVPEVQTWLAEDTRRWALPFTAGTLAVAMLLEPLIGARPVPVALTAVAALAVVGAVALAQLRDPVRALLALCAFTTVAVALDVALGAPLTRWSFLGYDLVTGGRFYGIGNEFAGVLLGASLVAAATAVALGERFRPVVLPIVGLGLIGLVGLSVSPMLGADAGGALSAAVGYGVALYGFFGGRLTWRRLAALATALLVFAVAGLFLANVILSRSDGSHVGRFLVRVANGDFGFVSSTVLRKLAANAHLLGVSQWSRLLIVALALCASLVWRHRASLGAALRRRPALGHGLAGLVAGGLAGLAFNDSGVVMLATMSPFAVLLLLALVSEPNTEAA